MGKTIRDIPPYMRKRKMKLNLLLLGLCGSLFATKNPNGILPDPPPGVTNNVTVTVCPDTGKVFFTHNAPGNKSGGGPPNPIRGGASEPSRVVFQSERSSDFSGGGPVCFTNQPSPLVQTIMLAVRADPADLATLVDAPETARLRIARGDGWALPGMTPMERQLTGQFLSDTGLFTTSWMVVEICFDSPAALSSLRFGNSAGPPEWDRLWKGEIRGVVCLDAPLEDEDTRQGLASFLALRGGFPGYPYQATYAQRKAAIEAGLKSGVDWATLIIVR
jgi:hypothetical protein